MNAGRSGHNVMRLILRLLTLPFRLAGRLLGALLSVQAVRTLLLRGLLVAALFAAETVALALLIGRRHDAVLAFVTALTWCLTLWCLFSIWRYRRGRARLHIQRFESFLALSPAQFEEAVGELLRGRGFRNVCRVGGAGDLGADLLCKDRKGRSVVVQCKRYAPGVRVGSRDVQTFIGMITVYHQAERGIFVTTSTFTAPAESLAREHRVELVDGPLLARMALARGRRLPDGPAA